MHHVKFTSTWQVPDDIWGAVFDKDGVLLDSEQQIRRVINDTVERLVGRPLEPNELEEIAACFGQPDDLMSQAVWEVLGRVAWANDKGDLSAENFVERFAAERARAWHVLSSDGSLKPKPGALESLAAVRTRKLFSAMYTSMPSVMVAHTVKNVLQACDLFYGERLLCVDDPRLEGRGKPDPQGWDVLARLARKKANVETDRLLAIEDRASGAFGALLAGYGRVVVVPDSSDGPLDSWDARDLIATLLSQQPELEQRLVFLHSLSDLQW